MMLTGRLSGIKYCQNIKKKKKKKDDDNTQDTEVMNRDDPKPNFISICFHFEDKSRPDVQSSTYAELGNIKPLRWQRLPDDYLISFL